MNVNLQSFHIAEGLSETNKEDDEDDNKDKGETEGRRLVIFSFYFYFYLPYIYYLLLLLLLLVLRTSYFMYLKVVKLFLISKLKWKNMKIQIHQPSDKNKTCWNIYGDIL